MDQTSRPQVGREDLLQAEQAHSIDSKRPESESTQWVPMIDYAVQQGISMSTLRRYIKANKIRYRIENGRYLLPSMDVLDLNPPPRELELELIKAREEISELKMLVAIYEEKLSQ